ncbi:cupin domain-containing protein [Rhizobium sp. S163]|uniref:cupin domain-containing protein n=1 Tax=Rhizobium sp. S163 TaxID=3055039 RepID=UPI0025A9F8BD|nr:cupin domain-containing protein [Rhizobium sp. S163]MDM9648363.1 cupin domain-containing protein [Rhizobium sp. S163]
MRTLHVAVLAAAVSASAAIGPAYAQQPIKRTDLIDSPIDVPGHKVVQVRVDFGPGVLAGNHSHPGEEIAYVVKGSVEYALEGRDPVVLHAGQSLFIPSGVKHSARNVGEGSASELATYIVEEGKQLVVLAK